MESVPSDRHEPHGPAAAGDVRPACVCGHDAFDHSHYRPGSDCGRCGCTTYRSGARGLDRIQGGVRAVLRRFAGR